MSFQKAELSRGFSLDGSSTLGQYGLCGVQSSWRLWVTRDLSQEAINCLGHSLSPSLHSTSHEVPSLCHMVLRPGNLIYLGPESVEPGAMAGTSDSLSQNKSFPPLLSWECACHSTERRVPVSSCEWRDSCSCHTAWMWYCATYLGSQMWGKCALLTGPLAPGPQADVKALACWWLSGSEGKTGLCMQRCPALSQPLLVSAIPVLSTLQ